MVDVQFWLQLAVVLFCLAVGGRFGGVGLGAAGGFGVSVLVLGFGMQPGLSRVKRLLHALGDPQEKLRFGHEKICRLFSELEQADLILRKRQGQGKPSIIYLKKF